MFTEKKCENSIQQVKGAASIWYIHSVNSEEWLELDFKILLTSVSKQLLSFSVEVYSRLIKKTL